MLRTVGNSCQLRIEKCKFLNVYVEDLVLLRKQTKKRNKHEAQRIGQVFYLPCATKGPRNMNAASEQIHPEDSVMVLLCETEQVKFH